MSTESDIFCRITVIYNAASSQITRLQKLYPAPAGSQIIIQGELMNMKEHNKEEQPYMSEKLVIFNRIYKEYNEIYHDAATRLGLSNSEFDTLYAICELGDGCKQSDICRTTFIPKQTVNSAIRVLEKKDYLTLASGKGRSMHIYLTEQGLQLVRRTIFPMVEIENEAFPKLTEKEYKSILHFHTQYLTALREGIQKL